MDEVDTGFECGGGKFGVFLSVAETIIHELLVNTIFINGRLAILKDLKCLQLKKE